MVFFIFLKRANHKFLVGLKNDFFAFVGSIAEAQEWEYKLIEVQDWLTDKDISLTSHLEQELTVEDLPEDAQVNKFDCVNLQFSSFNGALSI